MGYRVESYSLNELHRIAVPGTVEPVLFWAIPVGRWLPQNIDKLWRAFTKDQSKCKNFGLLLAKNLPERREHKAASVNLASLGAKLSDLMPSGSEHFVSTSVYSGDTPKLLMLSGGYPQPGWGVLIELDWRRVGDVEQLIEEVIGKLEIDETSKLKLPLFIEAANSLQHWRELCSDPGKPDVSALDGEILAAEKVDVLLQDVRGALLAGQYSNVGKKGITVIDALRQASWLGISEDLFQPLQEAQRNLLTAASIAAVSVDIFASEIKPKLATCIADASQKEAAFRSLPSKAVKDAFRACLYLQGEGIVGKTECFQAWADRILKTDSANLMLAVDGVIKAVEDKLVNHRGIKEQREREYKKAALHQGRRRKEARESFHLATGRAVELQWALGPQFLIALEHICRKSNLWVRSVPWDPARMVGWKIMSSDVILRADDLQDIARKLAPGVAGGVPLNSQPMAVADGGYFTDYVHYIAISRPGFSPREVTHDLLDGLLRASEKRKIISACGGPGDQSGSQCDAQLAEDLLNVLGWRQMDDVCEIPLAAYVGSKADPAPILSKKFSGNDLRITLESFCKDVVDVVVAQLGYKQEEIWRAVEEGAPEYKPASRTKDWNEEVKLLTAGKAELILETLAPLAFPERNSDVSQFIKTLHKLSVMLNQASHHREGAPVELDGAAVLICQLLTNAEAFLGELPWHLDASCIYGEQPKVLSGEAWSHGSPMPRSSRVILWTGSAPDPKVIFWNPTRRNPIVPDPVFIVRPGRC